MPSRRLGRSLGLDLVPMKTCTLDCVYCQLGRGSGTVLERGDHVPVDELLAALEESLAADPRADYITLSGSGEPTLHVRMGEIVRRIRAVTPIPVALITNGTLLWDEAVRRESALCDLVLPSLDAGDEETFRRVNRPHADLPFERFLDGMIAFRGEYGGPIWLEVMIVAGLNDGEESLAGIKSAAARIRPDRIQLNSVVRLPAEKWAAAATHGRLEQIRDFFGETAEIVADYSGPHSTGRQGPRRSEILEMLRRRPCSVDDIAGGLLINRHELAKELALLEAEGLICGEDWSGRRLYRASES